VFKCIGPLLVATKYVFILSVKLSVWETFAATIV